MLYNPFNFQDNDNWDTDGLYWYNEFYTKKPVWTSLNQFHGLQKTGPRWSGLVPTISGSVLDWLQFTVACFGGEKPDWTGLANTIQDRGGGMVKGSQCLIDAMWEWLSYLCNLTYPNHVQTSHLCILSLQRTGTPMILYITYNLDV